MSIYNLRHAAFTEFFEDFVMEYSFADHMNLERIN